jgi:predicted enzyme related to lactoylglutathione lyase
VTAHRAPTRSPGTFCWLDLKTRDVSATAAFFSTALGWTFAVDPDDWRQATKIALNGTWLGGVSDLAGPVYPPGVPPHVAYYLAVDDVDARAATAQEAGAQVVLPPSDVADQGRLATLVDPFGAAVSLWRADVFSGWTHEPGAPCTPTGMVHRSPQPDAARRFYADAFGMPAGAARFGSGDPGWQATVTVPDLVAVARRVAAAGAGTCTWDEDELHLADPQGLPLTVLAT